MNHTEFRTLRSRAGLAQARVAARGRIDHTRLCMWEKGNITLATEQVALLEKALLDLISESAEEMGKLAVESRHVAVA